jgi:hypothetical protein
MIYVELMPGVNSVIPARRESSSFLLEFWIPASAGMTDAGFPPARE